MKFTQIFERALGISGALLSFLTISLFSPECKANEKGVFEVGINTFLLNGKPIVIKAAELHYPRIPRDYWEQRIQMCKSLGMNTVCLYTFWNVHESNEDSIDFTDQNSIRDFILLCQKNQLNVILRPGPYICAEWEMGGLPWWLLKKKDIKLRDNDPYFMERVSKFQTALYEEIGDLTIDKGGPIIMIQVENEYGAYGENKEYIGNIRDILRSLYGEKVVMFQCDWSSNFTLNGLDDLVWTMNFGTGADIESQFSELKKRRPESPMMCSEFWSGWFDKWGAPHETRPADEMIAGIDDMLSKNISFSLYMTHGGTNWGHWAGANSPGYAPDVTSYDYDAPINEYGHPTEKYWLLRETLKKYCDTDSLPSLPDLINPISLDTIKLTEVAPLFSNLPAPVFSEYIKPMEDFNQGYGSILYSTILPTVKEGTVLRLKDVHDYGQVFVNQEYIGTVDRRLGQDSIVMPECDEGDKLEILVEAMGRINFGVAIKDYKGITETVYLTEKQAGDNHHIILKDWEVSLFPDEYEFYKSLNYVDIKDIEKNSEGLYGRGVYKGAFTISKTSDTFLNFETWGKGLIYLNGHPLGRIWNIGPQQTLYVPGPWLKEGENELLVFDIKGPSDFFTYGLERPIINKLQDETNNENTDQIKFDFGNLNPVYGGAFPQGNGWKTQIFPEAHEGRYLVIEAVSPYEGYDYFAISEFYALDDNGKRIDRENWKIIYSDSEDTATGNNTAAKIFDLQESTYWKSLANLNPQKIIIDMGREEWVKGVEYLPRMEKGAPGAIKDFRIYILK